MEIKLTLTIEEVNGIIGTLSMLPFNQVAGLVAKIREQAIPQVQAAEAAGNHGFSNLLAERMSAHKKNAWMLRSTMKDSG